MPQLFALLIVVPACLGFTACLGTSVVAAEVDTFSPLADQRPPRNLTEMWGDFDPRAEPLEIETLLEWDEDGVALKIVRFRVGIFKGQRASIAAVYGYPKGKTNLPGLVQIHGGGQYADANACLANAKRGYATVSLAWAGRISSSKYRVNPDGVKLFWDGKTDDPNYRLTTDWGAVDGYHAPSRHPKNQFPSADAGSWTLDSVESPRNSGWFLCATAARRALTFLEQQPEVDPNRLGVYGHSMGGKLTVMASVDSRVKAAAPSCGGISDRQNESKWFRNSLGDDASLQEITCPIIFLSPANDFHGRIVDLPATISEIQSQQWRVTCSPQHNHQDTPPYEVATLLWFDQHLMHKFAMPESPTTDLRLERGKTPSLEFTIDTSMPVRDVDVFYTQQAKQTETPQDREFTMNRFWHHVKPTQADGRWIAKLPISSTDQPLMAYANVSYSLDEPVSGAGYYYRIYHTDDFNLSSLVTTAWTDGLTSSGVLATLQPTHLIETFQGDWEKEWFTYRMDQWGRSTHKLNDPSYAAPHGSKLAIEVQSNQPNKLVLRIDDHIAVVSLEGKSDFQSLVFSKADFKDFAGNELADWDTAKRFTLSPQERLTPPHGVVGEPRNVGGQWNGDAPKFRNLRWNVNRTDTVN